MDCFKNRLGGNVQNLIQFIVANKAAVALLVYAILDIVILINPKLQANGVVHQVQLWAQALSGKGPQPPIAS